MKRKILFISLVLGLLYLFFLFFFYNFIHSNVYS